MSTKTLDYGTEPGCPLVPEEEITPKEDNKNLVEENKRLKEALKEIIKLDHHINYDFFSDMRLFRSKALIIATEAIERG